MSHELDQKLAGTGTRFRLFAQSPSLARYAEPEVVWVSSPARSLRPGPEDERMRVLDAVDKRPYDDLSGPPWNGSVYPAAEPDPAGHFDHHPIDSRAFTAAHMFGAIRRVLDIWEDYVGSPINFRSILETPTQQVELIPLVNMERNAQTGMGYIETGYLVAPDQQRRSLCLNMDIIAHEVGHRIVFDRVGIPLDSTMTAEYRGFSESASDLVALVTALHFDSVIDNVLQTSSGNLYVLNELNRFAELADHDQIRIASNSKRMSDVVDVATPWNRLSQPEIHELGEPLTGAVFDIFVEIFHRKLADTAAISRDLADYAWHAPTQPMEYEQVQARFDSAYDQRPQAFHDALLAARDALGERLALTLGRLSRDLLTYRDVAATFLGVDRSLSGREYQQAIADSFAWRGIGVPRPLGLAPAGEPAGRSGLASRRLLCDRSPSTWREERRRRSPCLAAAGLSAPAARGSR
jgi:hypothetical protein